MNIIYIGAFRFPKYDAAAARVLNNARALRDCGHNVEIISWGGQYEDSVKVCGDLDTYGGFNYTVTGELDIKDGVIAKMKNRLNRGGKSLKILKSRKQTPDLIITYNPDLIFNYRLKRFASRHGIKYANDITEWSDKNELRLFERLTNAINLKYLTKRVKNKIVISSYLNNYYSAGNNIIVPPLCDLTEVKWTRNSSAETQPGIITFIYAGNPARKDSLHVVINSMQRSLERGFNFKLLILGVTEEQYIGRYSSLLNNTKLDDRIVFMGRVPQDEVPSYYSESDFMVLIREPNRKSMAGFPTKFAESFAAGIPVVANKTSDICDYLIDGQTGFVVQNHSEEALEEVFTRISGINRETVVELKRKVAEMSEKFDYRYHVARFQEFITNLM